MIFKSIFGGLVAAAALVAAIPVAHFDADFKASPEERAAIHARTLVNFKSIANLATINDGYPVSSLENYADCNNDGSLTLLSTSFNNLTAGSLASLSIRGGRRGRGGHGRKDSSVGPPRVSLRGNAVQVEDTDDRLAKCFLDKHPDAELSDKWVQFNVESVEFIGFGGKAFEIPLDQYKGTQPHGRHGNHGKHGEHGEHGENSEHTMEDHPGHHGGHRGHHKGDHKFHGKGGCKGRHHRNPFRAIPHFVSTVWNRFIGFFLPQQSLILDTLVDGFDHSQESKVPFDHHRESRKHSGKRHH